MRHLLTAIVVCATATCAAAVSASAAVPPGLGARLIDGYIRPATGHFANSAAALSGDLDRLCKAPDQTRMDTVRQRFDDVVDAWFRISFLRFGPLIEDNRFERIFFWPDPRGVILRQVGEIIAKKDGDAIDPAKLAGKSVAVQGLPALEYALYGTGASSIVDGTEEGRFRCGYALSISIVIAENAAAVARAWSPDSDYAREFADPGPDNRIYRSPEEVATEAIKALAGGMTYLADAVIAPFVGKEPEQANARLAPLWRSGTTIRAIRRSVEGLRDFYTTTGFAQSFGEADHWIDGSLRLEMRRVLETLDRIDMPLEEAVSPGPGREALVYVVIALKSLHTTLDNRLAQAVGVSVGFNALDGD